ncbi:NADH-quinone oxidoreductase subunit NuoE family protein [Anaeromicrobium sediminis]|uniref:NAD(P)H-dependent oxidoreductase subunit E n=1 Tax=Anaeromicrobium sediminis TaxID=1478221 RepID=A0A267MCB5_9FIRM|nr:NAD(P)H-dependent oxidoreductase subunit E [Anaeromicrobium sediminis]PAB57022.1 NAD(P)H-dependent oxidoreductase subunit E [Anaeromicrobium sediminis]
MSHLNLDVQIPETENLGKEKFEELREYIKSLDTIDGALISILHKAQTIFGYLPKEVQLFVARTLDLPGAEVYGVVSFYSYFTTEPVGKYTVSVCMGTACFVRGADKVVERISERLNIKPEETTGDGLFTLKSVRCIGACGLAPVVTIGEKVYGRVTVDEMDEILDSYTGEEA